MIMIKKLFLFLVTACLAAKVSGQCTPLVFSASNAQHTDISSILELNIETDFCADGSDMNSDQAAFEAASNFINARGGYCRLIIPEGGYRVGRQEHMGGYFSYAPANVLNIQNCANVEIKGIGQPVLRYDEGFHYGYFDETTGLPLTDAQATLISVDAPGQNPANWAIMNFMINISYEKANNTYFKISNLVLDGNVHPGQITLGGKDEIQGIQLAFDGIRIWEASHVTIDNVTTKYFGRDGIYIGNRTDQKNVLINNCVTEYNGRQGLTIAAGDSITVRNSRLNNAGMGEVASIPASAVNIEEEISGQKAQNIIFDSCHFEQNRKGAIDITSGFGQGKGFFFNNCTIVAMKNPESPVPGANNGNVAMELSLYKKIRFYNCKIYGVILDGGNGATNPDDGVHFKKCYFSDCYHKYDATANAMIPVAPYTHSTVTYVTRDDHSSDYLKIDSCNFELFYKRLWRIVSNPATPAGISNTTIKLATPNTYSDYVNIGIDSNATFNNNTFFYYYYQTYRHVANGTTYESPYAISGINFWHWNSNGFYPPVCPDTIPGQQAAAYQALNEQHTGVRLFSLYPNPAINGKFAVDHHQDGSGRYLLMDIGGHKFDEGNLRPYATTAFDYRHLPPGIYLFRVLHGLDAQTEKIILY